MTKANKPAAEWVSPDSLVPWERNPRKNKAAVADVAKSIQRFGFGSTVVARKSDRRIVAGHTRVEAAKMLGLDRVPVRFLELSDEQATELALADNKLGELAQWDIPGLSSFIDEGFDLQELGWSELELKDMELAEEPAVSVSNSATMGGKKTSKPVERSSIVSALFVVEDTDIVERALDKASRNGETTRGEALRTICEAYLAKA